jgi:hypothetical protein
MYIETIIFFAIGFTIMMAFAANSGDTIKNKYNMDEILLYLEKKRNSMTEEKLEKYVRLYNNYRDKVTSPRLTSPMYLSRVDARNQLKDSCEKLRELYNETKNGENDGK